MKFPIALIALIAVTFNASALGPNATATDKQAIQRAVLDYIESQHQVQPEMMALSLDPDLVKRTYWLNEQGKEFILETNYADMIHLAGTYNQNGDRFPANPKVDINILDIDQRVASVKLTVNDWIDYMHLYKNQDQQWKIINVLWQFHENERQRN
jgi:hypothetical protein